MKKNKPNIIVFFTDQQRWDTMGLNGNPMRLTPNLDRLARRGTFFKEATTPQPVCGPARSCLQTGQYATTTGVYRNGPGLKEDSPKLAELFNEAGYHTSYIGKWHLSEKTGHGAVPKENRGGYQEWLAANCVELESGPYSACLWDDNDQKRDFPGYRSDAMVDVAIQKINRYRQDKKPYLLYLSFLEPHHQNTNDSYPAPQGMEHDYMGGWMPPDLQALGGSSARQWAGYCAMVKRLDDGLGRIWDALKSTGQADHTVICFISDHGCHFKTRNGEYKRSPHESSVRVPFVLTGDCWNAGGEHTCAASLVDLAPSLLDTAGIAIPETMQGNSLLPVVHHAATDFPQESFIQFGDGGMAPGRALRSSRWKYAVTGTEESINQACAQTYAETHLYDLQTDPYELSNLIHENGFTELRRELASKLSQRMKATGETNFTIEPASANDGPTQRTIKYPNAK